MPTQIDTTARLLIRGGQPLHGEVAISGAKNAALPILAATFLAEEPSVLRRVPRVGDTLAMVELMRSLGAEARWEEAALVVRPPHQLLRDPPAEQMRALRASICMLGPLLARRREVQWSLPGGCQIGERPIDLHLRGLRALGAEVDVRGDLVMARLPGRLAAAEIDLAGPRGSSVLATANTLMAATLAEGRTTIRHAACEPEIVDLAEFLRKMGAAVSGHGTPTIVVEGVDRLHAAEHEIISDRIEAGTFLFAVAAAGGDVTLQGVDPNRLAAPLDVLRRAGVSLEIEGATIRVWRAGALTPVDVVARAYPEFPTDLQAPWTAVMSLAAGRSSIGDEVFPDRFAYVPQLVRMGCKLSVRRGRVEIEGVRRLQGATTEASDLRASAALVIAGLAAEGTSQVRRLAALDRGYEQFALKLGALGADVVRESD